MSIQKPKLSLELSFGGKKISWTLKRQAPQRELLDEGSAPERSSRASRWAGRPGRPCSAETGDRSQAVRWRWRPVSDCAISFLQRSIMRPQPVKNHSLSWGSVDYSGYTLKKGHKNYFCHALFHISDFHPENPFNSRNVSLMAWQAYIFSAPRRLSNYSL